MASKKEILSKTEAWVKSKKEDLDRILHFVKTNKNGMGYEQAMAAIQSIASNAYDLAQSFRQWANEDRQGKLEESVKEHRTFRKFIKESVLQTQNEGWGSIGYKVVKEAYKDAPTVGKFLDLNDIEGDEFNRKMDAYTWDKFLKDAHDGKLPRWFDHSDTAARDKIWEYAKKKSGMNDKAFAQYVSKSITWFPGVNESKSFRKYLKESILQTQNEGWGFFGTISNEFDHNTYANAKEAWKIAFQEVQKATGWTDIEVRVWLDSKDGRHFADQCADFGAADDMRDGISQAAKFYRERKWFHKI